MKIYFDVRKRNVWQNNVFEVDGKRGIFSDTYKIRLDFGSLEN